ncbi:hypothetical protein GCM10023322_44190 [Rugosimonospora acidiphila]|uniref:Uncharacterized protein n=1 Tax=Rugosimonospora acidiphila TaxID=556531 RepID=A0ABP9S0X6_9ACTN
MSAQNNERHRARRKAEHLLPEEPSPGDRVSRAESFFIDPEFPTASPTDIPGPLLERRTPEGESPSPEPPDRPQSRGPEGG